MVKRRNYSTGVNFAVENPLFVQHTYKKRLFVWVNLAICQMTEWGQLTYNGLYGKEK